MIQKGDAGLEIDKERYKRNILLAESRVLVVGAGGLGSPVSLYLAAAGVGTIGIADFDRVDVSNLQRQILYREQDIGKAKAELAAEQLQSRNHSVQVELYPEGITAENAEEILAKFDVIVDASDNFPTRYLLSDTCMKLGKPDVYGAICEFAGQVTVFASDGPCLRCLCPEAEEGGPIALVKNGDRIQVDLYKGMIHLDVSDEELISRRNAWEHGEKKKEKGLR